MPDTPSAARPRSRRRATSFTVVVEGVGNVVDSHYSEAFVAALESSREVEVYFCDDSRNWRDDATRIKRADTITTLRGWRAKFIDKANAKDRRLYRRLRADVVIIATPPRWHCRLATEWYRRRHRPKRIYIEKPLDVSMDAVNDLLDLIGADSDCVFAFDHYRARMLPLRENFARIMEWLGYGIVHFEFYLLEDRSGADPIYSSRQKTPQRDGAIENEARVDLFRGQGLIPDLFPHVLAALAFFAVVQTSRIQSIRAAQYTGVDQDPGKPTEIDRETFFEVKWTCFDTLGHRIECVAYGGKGLRGSRVLGEEFDHDTKALLVRGVNGNGLLLDLRRRDLKGNPAARLYFLNPNGERARDPEPIELRDAYRTFIERAIADTCVSDLIVMPVETGRAIVQLVLDVGRPIRTSKESLPTYPSGMAVGRDMPEGRPAPYLEDGAVARVPVLWVADP
jgi:hypothetical protein